MSPVLQLAADRRADPCKPAGGRRYQRLELAARDGGRVATVPLLSRRAATRALGWWCSAAHALPDTPVWPAQRALPP